MGNTTENAGLKQQLRELLDKASSNQAILERFQKFELTMLSADNIAELLRILLQNALQHFQVANVRLVWFEAQQEVRELIPEIIRQHYGYRLLFNGLTNELNSVFSGQYRPVLRVISQEESRFWFTENPDVQSAAFIPLVCDGVLYGAYLLGSEDVQRFTSDKAVDFMSHMGLIAAVCLQNTLNKERIRQLSMIDNLTRVKNRRCFDSDINKEVARALRSKKSLSCLFIDADFFKRVNDTYGHQAGDEVLCALANNIKSMLREGDHLARFGGEEFVVLLPDCDADLAVQVAERIRIYVASQAIVFADLHLQVTVSIGVATLNGATAVQQNRGEVITALLACADAAVYESKSEGRNCVRFRKFAC